MWIRLTNTHLRWAREFRQKNALVLQFWCLSNALALQFWCLSNALGLGSRLEGMGIVSLKVVFFSVFSTFSIFFKHVFFIYFFVPLGSVHKYFGGGAGQLKIFVVKLFWPPFASRQNFLNPPSTSVKTFLTPPIATCIISVSFLNTNLFGMHHRCTSITGNT